MTRAALTFILALLGLVLIGQGAYIHAKAPVAQVLLARAFDESVATGRIVKPWSWADTWPVARIEVTRLHASAIVLAGSIPGAVNIPLEEIELSDDRVADGRGPAVALAREECEVAAVGRDVLGQDGDRALDDLGERGIALAYVADHRAQRLDRLLDQRQAEFVDRGEVPVERRRDDADLLGELAQ